MHNEMRGESVGCVDIVVYKWPLRLCYDTMSRAQLVRKRGRPVMKWAERCKCDARARRAAAAALRARKLAAIGGAASDGNADSGDAGGGPPSGDCGAASGVECGSPSEAAEAFDTSDSEGWCKDVAADMSPSSSSGARSDPTGDLLDRTEGNESPGGDAGGAGAAHVGREEVRNVCGAASGMPQPVLQASVAETISTAESAASCTSSAVSAAAVASSAPVPAGSEHDAAACVHRAILRWSQLPDSTPTHAATSLPSLQAAEMSSLLDDWLRRAADMLFAAESKARAGDDIRRHGVSLVQLPMPSVKARPSLEHLELLSGHTHLQHFVHCDAPSRFKGRLLTLDGHYIEYALPAQKQIFDPSSLVIYLPDCGTRMVKATGSLRARMAPWTVRIADYVQECSNARARVLSTSPDGMSIEHAAERCTLCSATRHTETNSVPMKCPVCRLAWHEDCHMSVTKSYIQHKFPCENHDVDVNSGAKAFSEHLRSLVLSIACLDDNTLAHWHRLLSEDASRPLLCHWWALLFDTC